MSDLSPSQPLLARRAWALMFDFLLKTAPERTRHLAERGLTPNDARALETLGTQQGQTMRALARTWACDPSNATWVVDRLEKLGLAERRASPSDRRVKLVLLTAQGQETKAALHDAFYAPPPEILGLSVGALGALTDVLERLGGTRAAGKGDVGEAKEATPTSNQQRP